jgi:hypothetical protein
MSGNSVKMLHVTNPFFERSSTIELTNQYPTPQKARILFKAITIAITPFPQPQQNKAKCQKSLLGNKRHNTLYTKMSISSCQKQFMCNLCTSCAEPRGKYPALVIPNAKLCHQFKKK